MKRIIVLLIACLVIVSMSACSPAEPGNAGTPNATVSANNQEDNIAEITDAPATEALQLEAFEEITVVDDANCAIKITGVEDDSIWGFSLKVYLENKTSDKTFMFSTLGASINGVEVEPFWAQEVAPGKKSNESITFLDSGLEDNNVGTYTDVFVNFRVYDNDDWSAEDIAQASVHVYPYGETNAKQYVRETLATDTVLVDNDNVTVIVADYVMDDIWGYTAKLYIVNKTDTTIMVSVDDAAVNGYMLDPFFATSVMPGVSKFGSISWSTSAFEENNISEVESIEFILRVYDNNDWSAEDFVNEQVTLTP